MNQLLEEIKTTDAGGSKEPCGVKGCDKTPTEILEVTGAVNFKCFLCKEVHLPFILNLHAKHSAAALIQLREWGV